ncbi:8084_t:CDS:2, partial [Scutellospora calospora]
IKKFLKMALGEVKVEARNQLIVSTNFLCCVISSSGIISLSTIACSSVKIEDEDS